MTTQQIDGPSQDVPLDPNIQEEIASLYGGLGGADYRADVPEGTVLAETYLEGQPFRAIKGKPFTRNGVPVPSRTTVYDTRTGMPSRVPTKTLYYQLAKTRKEDGSRVYSTRPPVGVTPPTPIADTCQICYRNRGNKHRNFYSEFDLLTHMQLFHTLEWNAMERDRDIRERRAEAGRMEQLVSALIGLVQGNPVAGLSDEVKTQITDLQDVARRLEDTAQALHPVEEPQKGKGR